MVDSIHKRTYMELMSELEARSYKVFGLAWYCHQEIKIKLGGGNETYDE